MRHTGVVVGIDREKIGIHGHDVFGSGAGEHHFECLEALSISLECIYLSFIIHESANARAQ